MATFITLIYLYNKMTNTDTHPSTQTSRGQAAAHGSVEAGLTDAWIRIKHAAQLDLAQAGDLGITAPLILERQLVTVQPQRAQASLESVLGSWLGLRPPVPEPRPRARPLARPAHWPHLGPKEK